ncbi:hypothetical protein COOONC_18570 [Cooperia oncophora]
MSEPERNKEGAVTKASSSFVVKLLPAHCRNRVATAGCRLTLSSLLRTHISAAGHLASQFLGSPLKGFKISFQGSISVRKIDDDANQEEKARNFDESRDVVLLRRLRKIARLEEEIRDLEVKHRLKVDELSDILED